jgi:hypothetical protein
LQANQVSKIDIAPEREVSQYRVMKINTSIPFIIVTLIFGTLYVAIQQSIRMGVNDQEVQLTDDLSAAIAAGAKPTDLDPGRPIDMAKSLAPVVALFDAAGKQIVSSALVNGKPLSVPAGVFEAARAKGEDRLTLEPAPGVRLAAVVRYYDGAGQTGTTTAGFALAARSLREAERRISDIGTIVLIGWALSILCLVYQLGARVHERGGESA